MSQTIQTAIVAALVAAAGAYVVVRLVRTMRAKSACGCGAKGCGSMAKAIEQAQREGRSSE